MDEILDLWDYRRRVAELYRSVRAETDPGSGWERWRTGRDELFRTHPQSPVPADRRSAFGGIPLFDYDVRFRVEAVVRPATGEAFPLGHSGAGSTPVRPFGVVTVAGPGGPSDLTLYWLDSYGGGVFLPFRDDTNGDGTYGGGRYLLDTVKGADLGHEHDRVVLDFNFAYHPSCVHDARWSCPLSPPGNRVAGRIEAGERLAGAGGSVALTG